MYNLVILSSMLALIPFVLGIASGLVTAIASKRA